MRRQSKKNIIYLGHFLALLFLTGCEKYYLSLTDQNINVDYLASVGAGTPDKRQQNPPFGEMIVMDWRIPKELLKQNPVIDLHVIYGNYTEKTFHYPLKKRMGYVTYKDIDAEYAEAKGIITYRANIRLEDGTIYRDWKHQLWTNLITVSDETPQPSPSTPPPLPLDSSPADKEPEKETEEHSEDDYEEDEDDSNEGSDVYAEGNSKSSSDNTGEDQNESEDIVDESDEGDDSPSSADNMSSFVEDQSMQGSVTDTDDWMDEVSSDNG